MRRHNRHMTPETIAYERALRNERRGTIIVLALAVLAIISIAALSYVSIVRIDRNATSAVASQVNFQRQVNGVTGHIGAIIGADLAGGKIVTNNVPKFDSNGNSIWPRFFEDGETWDYPFTDLDWVADPEDYGPNGNSFYEPSSANYYERVARPEEAWLASTEPRWTPNPDNTTIWPQVTNLRSALTYYPREVALDAGWWVRGDGKYVDLYDWFDKATVDGRGNPGLDLLALDTTPTELHGDPIGPEGGVWFPANASDPRLTTAVFGTFISELHDNSVPGELTNFDQRMWVDTDGDLRPDSRWTQLPEILGNLQGLNWVVAARIIDASGFANYNSHIEFNYDTNDLARVSTGRTPADFDLIGLLQTAANTTDFDASVITNQLASSFPDHLEIGLGFTTQLTSALNSQTPYTVQSYNNWTFGNRLTRAQRLAHYTLIGNSPDSTNIGGANFYRDTDLIDLRSYWATNSRALSRIEERLDGPENGGYLPGKDDNAGDFGPTRAREEVKLARHLEGPLGEAQPQAERIRADIRRLLMPVTGEGLFSPLPIANPKHPAYTSNSALAKVVLPIIEQRANAGSLTNEEVMDILAAYAWALLPEASLDPVYPDSLTTNAPASQTDPYYGGGPNGPAEAYRDQLFNAPDIGAAYAFMRAAASVVNLIDAMDDASPAFNASTIDDPPVIARIRNLPAANASLYNSGPHDVPAGLIDQGVITDEPGIFELNTVFPFATIAQDLLPQEYVGTPAEGFTVVGTERTPFLVEASSLMVYHDSQTLQETGGGPGSIGNLPEDSAEVDTGLGANFLGCIISIELGNPWPQEVRVSDYRIELVNGLTTAGVNGRRLSLDLDEINTGGTTIPPGERKIFNFLIRNDDGTGISGAFGANAEFDEIRDFWETFLDLSPNGDKELAFTPNDYEPDVYDNMYNIVTYDGFDIPSIIHSLGEDETTGQRRPATVNLIRKASTGDVPFDLLVDRMSPPSQTNNIPTFPVSGLSDTGGGERYESQPMCSLGNPEGALRIAFLSSLHRPDNRSALGFPQESGFPAYVVEDREQNVILPTADEPPIGIWWHETPPASDPNCEEVSPPPTDNLFEPANIALDDLTKDDFVYVGNVGTLSLPPFQIFCPDEPLKTKADLLMVSAFATTYYNDVNAATNLSIPDKEWVRDAWDTSRVTDFTGATPAGAWLTLSEQLAQTHNFLYWSNQDLANPYFGMLDPTRWNLSDTDPVLNWPQQRAPEVYGIPAAVRAIDCFEVIDPISTLVEGRININSAPDEVLRHIPFLSPKQQITTAAGGTLDIGAFYDERLLAVQRHRDRLDINNVQSTPWNETNLPGFRQTNQLGNAINQARGFVTAAELALLEGHEVSGGQLTGQLQANPTRFGELGNDGQTDGLPLELYGYDTTTLPPAGNLDEATYGLPEFNPVDDPEERTAIYRGMANTVTARSDIFMATFVLRGYSPSVIDGIDIDNDFGGDAQAAMDSEEFFPAYESRWLAVFDRSNIVTPTDRPRLLKLIELPVIKP